ncbi:MAG: multidrug ABC transporter ATP-binding protein [Chloroflexi bacterium GWB2_49_20]|nr:MAG: multidrug ABC transporter ATP-binding protein [Chloroflexi bacterium GWB2_49_20]OGN76869.1 MAG: multidrug ABC transporter ATP-binding protein [Chloroflexi bacterium GWC2_49_37]OGN84389.1 MAG: multidrug ABC transporter ATP-binding protein [Chloroflexi bacterium GWD2_49_16]HCC78224.1 multidrug ABC transporter ATP-binding protein [Anaerolineae bacterium]HCM96743.1 multidrug ABC transporter ATP-binding protein [Anaerolineae bacterium]
MKPLIRIAKFAKPYWKESAIALVLLTTVVFLDLVIPRLIQKIIDQGIAKNNMTLIVNTTWLMLGISVVNTLFAIGNNIYSVKVGESFGRDLRERLFVKIQTFSFGNLDRMKTGQLMVRLTSDVSIVQRVVQVFLRIGTRAPMLMAGSILLMFATNAHLAFLILILLAFTILVITLFTTQTGPLYLGVQKRLDKMNTVMQENISGVRVVKAFVLADFENNRFDTANQDFAEKTIHVTQVMSVLFPILTALMNIGVVIIIWSGGLTTIQGNLTVGQIVAFANYLLTTVGPLGIMAQLSSVIASGMASAGRIEQVLEEPAEVQDTPGADAFNQEIQGQVTFEHVYFHYGGESDEPVLQDISFIAEAGKEVAILGATGSGKSSLVSLIPRFYDTTSGRVMIDGVDVRQIPKEILLAHISLAMQESVLFSGTIRGNICYGKPDASMEEIQEAARAAQAHDFIMELPQGYETQVEQRGVNLSGGQKQRIAIARAILLKPSILILDDSTSAVDVETETRVQNGLDKLIRGCTIFIVAQRISTVLNADKILVIDKGRLAAQGTHKELMRTSPIYQEIYASQLGNGVPISGAKNGEPIQ